MKACDSRYILSVNEGCFDLGNTPNSDYNSILSRDFLGKDPKVKHKVLQCAKKIQKPKKQTPLDISKKVNPRVLFPSCAKILDAPGLSSNLHSQSMDFIDGRVAFAFSTSVYHVPVTSLYEGQPTKILMSKEYRDPLSSIAWQSRHTYLAGSEKGTLYKHDFEKQAPVGRFDTAIDSPLHKIIFDHGYDRNTAYIAQDHGPLYRHDSRDKTISRILSDCYLASMAQSSTTLLTGSKAGTIQTWDLRRIEKPIRSFQLHTGPVLSLSISPHKQGQFLSSGGLGDGRIALWSQYCNEPVEFYESSTQVSSVLFNPLAKGEIISCHAWSRDLEHPNPGSHNFDLRLWSLDNGFKEIFKNSSSRIPFKEARLIDDDHLITAHAEVEQSFDGAESSDTTYESQQFIRSFKLNSPKKKSCERITSSCLSNISIR